jgi:acyl-coenzyme A thioesterase 13
LITDEFNGLDESHRLSFLERLGVRADDAGRLILEIRAGHLRTLGIAHGGVIATLLDSVMGLNANRSSPPDHYLVTAQLNVQFIRPAFEGETLIASSEVRHAGRKTAMAQGEILTADGHLVATASATFVYVAHTERTRANPDRIAPHP